MNKQEIGTIIRQRRQALGVNQLTLAELAGVGIGWPPTPPTDAHLLKEGLTAHTAARPSCL